MADSDSTATLKWWNDWPRWSHMSGWASVPAVARSLPLLVIIPLLSVGIQGWNGIREGVAGDEPKRCERSTDRVNLEFDHSSADLVHAAMRALLPHISLPLRMRLLFLGLVFVSAGSFVYQAAVPPEIRFLPGSKRERPAGRAQWCLGMLNELMRESAAKDRHAQAQALLGLLYYPNSDKKLGRATIGDDFAPWTIVAWNRLDTSRCWLRWLCLLLFTLGLGLFGLALLVTAYCVLAG